MMLRELIDDITAKLAENGVDPVYSAFDAKSVSRKGSSFFTVVGIGSFESSAPIYSPYTVFLPFRAEIEISIAAPEDYSMIKLYNYYDEKVGPVVSDMSGMTCRLSKMSVKFDSNIQRLVLNVRLSASGLTRIGRENV
ncbi:MAG: hypothetical protein IKH78_00645 [Ruminococcus sp.]|nr:hypothetical protein [Ruminococcus sp.]